MNTLPPDVATYDLALNLDLPDLKQLCQSNRFIFQLCQSDNFWYKKTLKDFGFLPNENNESWQQIYMSEYEKCIDKHFNYVKDKLDMLPEDPIILSDKMATIMGLTHFPIVDSKSVSVFSWLSRDGPIYTLGLFKQWWINYISSHNLVKNNMIYPDCVMTEAFSLYDKIRGRYVKSDSGEFNTSTLSFDLFNTIMNDTIHDKFHIFGDGSLLINRNIAKILCREKRRLNRQFNVDYYS